MTGADIANLLALFTKTDWNDAAQAAFDVLIMLAWLLRWTVLLRPPLGIAFYLTGELRLLCTPRLHRLLSLYVNVLRSLPSIILLIVTIPMTALLTDTSLRVEGTIPPLVAGCAPFFAQPVETALHKVEHDLAEASWSMGGSTWQLIWHTLLSEPRVGLIAAMTVTAILLADYILMAKAIGGSELGGLVIRFGYQRFQTDVMVATVLMLITLVQPLQMSGNRLVYYVSCK